MENLMLKVREAEILELKAQLKELREACDTLLFAHVREINRLQGENKC